MGSYNRIMAIDKIAEDFSGTPCGAGRTNLDMYGVDVFNEKAIRKYLPKGIAEALLETINNGVPLDPSIAGDVAHAMKEWAIDRGATHYTHWFQPLNGGTAEKHDAFMEPAGHGEAIMSFSGKNLIVGESDASSFPSGGIRSTFEARGYTAWDPTSPAFIKRYSKDAILCIPTAFCSYTGEALDKKTPLLRSMQALKASVRRLMSCFGMPNSLPVKITLGAEQEFFLIDKRFYLHRPDLLQCGRTVFGAPPSKHQQLEDHYFGSIKPRVANFMAEAEEELWKLGIPAKTRHNEAAPAQFELAPVFEELNLSVDHNMLVMEVLRTVADRHGLVCLLHEKPFAGVNGSGKHNNWSVQYGDRNLFDPGNDPEQNMIFLTVLAAVIRGIDKHADLLRSTTCSAGNDLRLGSNEAPPAIISIYLGDQLSGILDRILDGSEKSGRRSCEMRMGVDTLPPLPRDATDRNRTSPFAFTGNKFEFRAPGASQSCAGVCMMLNIIAAESMDYMSGRLEKLSPEEFNDGLQQVVKDVISKHRRVIFNGNGYSAEWVAEAGRRGLPNLSSTPEALKPLLDAENQDLVEKYGVFSKIEMISRYEVFLAEYRRRINIEGGISLEIARNMVLPAARSEFVKIAGALSCSQSTGGGQGESALKEELRVIGELLDRLHTACEDLSEELKENGDGVVPAMKKMRTIVDSLESVVDDDAWPLPKYREMLFIY